MLKPSEIQTINVLAYQSRRLSLAIIKLLDVKSFKVLYDFSQGTFLELAYQSRRTTLSNDQADQAKLIRFEFLNHYMI